MREQNTIQEEKEEKTTVLNIRLSTRYRVKKFLMDYDTEHEIKNMDMFINSLLDEVEENIKKENKE